CRGSRRASEADETRPRTARPPLRLEQRRAPAAPRAAEELAVVQPVVLVRPELDRVRLDAEAAPLGGTRHVAPLVAARERAAPRDEQRAARERPALVRGRAGELAAALARHPVGICLGIG